jgi:hypothetical protein
MEGVLKVKKIMNIFSFILKECHKNKVDQVSRKNMNIPRVNKGLETDDDR